MSFVKLLAQNQPGNNPQQFQEITAKYASVSFVLLSQVYPKLLMMLYLFIYALVSFLVCMFNDLKILEIQGDVCVFF